MGKISNFIQKFLKLRKEPLYMNSIYLMASTAMVSGSGFFLWMIAARLYSDAQVGLATALVSVVVFIMNLSILGFNYSIIRFLPKSKNRNQLISTSITVIGLSAMLCAGIFLTFLAYFSPKHLFMQQNPFMIFGFILFASAVAIDYATESIFLALRQGKYIFIKNIGTLFLKILLPILLVPFGAFGLFMALAIAISSALIISGYVLFKKFAFQFIPAFNKISVKQLVSFSSTNYIVSLTGIAPALILPIVITNTISSEAAAHFYITFMIANLLYTIPYAVTQSLFAEGSYNEKQFTISLKKALKLIGIILLPGILFLTIFGSFVLLVFGKSYSTEGVRFLQLLAVTGIPMALNFIGLTFLNIHKKMKPLLSINVVGAFAILMLTYVFREYALTGIGLAWLLGNILKTLLYAGYIASIYSKIQLFKPSFILRG